MRAITGFVLGIALMFVLAAAQKRTLEARVTQLEQELLTISIEKMDEEMAEISLNEQGYSVMVTKFGSFAFKVRNVEPFAGGTKTTLDVLNLTSALITEATLHITWKAKGKPVRTEHDILKALVPGIWVENEIKTTAVKPTDMMGMFVKIIPKEIQAARQ